MDTNRKKQEEEVMEYLKAEVPWTKYYPFNIRFIVRKIMDRYDLFDSCEDMPGRE